jgi:drug/metabolite transporter (DMT)-like permease
MDFTVTGSQTVRHGRQSDPVTRRATVLFLALGLAWGIPYLLIKVAVEELNPLTLVLARTLLAAVLLMPIALAKGAVRPVLRRWRPLLAYSVIEIVVPWLFLTRAEQHITSSLAGLLIAAVPFASVGVAVAFGRRERLGPMGLGGLLLGFAGVAFLVGVDVGGSQLGAVAEMAIVVACYATGAAILGKWMGDLPGIGVVALSVAIASLVYAPFAIPGLPTALPSAKVVASVLLLAVVCTAAAFLLLFALIGEIGPVRATTITYLNPVVAVLAGAVILGERITVWTVTGFALVLTGCLGVARSRRTPAPAPAVAAADDLALDQVALPGVPATAAVTMEA